ncbi:MAG: NAD(P)H-hydrate dehydratase [Candidatus Marinimicrobia bacterium]|nr:NAD(P)H-hydrate dehydratase [Candidatus Neomarinimicrobiota bacterium]
MKRIVTAKDAQAIDHDAIKVKGVSGTGLMLKAGTAVAEAAFALCNEKGLKHVQIFCGKGNNGGDGYVAAIKLHEAGLENIDVFYFTEEKVIQGDARYFYDTIQTLGIKTHYIQDIEELCSSLRENSCWIDAIFGTGLDRSVKGFYRDVLQCLYDLHKNQPIIAVDIPSGLSGTSGKLLGTALKATKTLSMGFYKSGNFLQDAKSYTGKLELVKLDYPADSFTKAETEMYLCDHELVREKLNPIAVTGHKYSAGQVLCVGGSAAMPGAVTLTSLAVLKSGAGMVRSFVPETVKPILLKQMIEAIVTTGENKDILTDKDLTEILALQEKSRAMIIGPGMGREPATGELIRALLKEINIPAVLDADALFHLSKEELKNKNTELIITPHTGEFARLMKIKTEDVLDAPIERALELAVDTNTIVHLKGSTSLTALPSGIVYIHSTGAPGMATAGSGDLLAGMIASFIAQGHKPEDAVLIAVYYHGTAGQAAAEVLGNRSLIASDILEHIPLLLKKDEVLS